MYRGSAIYGAVGNADVESSNHSITAVVETTPPAAVAFPLLFLLAPTPGSLLPVLEHRAEFPQFLDQGQSVGLLGRVISSSQGL
jgi:hypothetical protein